MILSVLFLLILQQGSDQISQTTFTMGRGGLFLEPENQAVLLDEDGLPVQFTLNYEGTLVPGARLRGSLVGPGLTTPYQVDVSAEDGRILLDRALFAQEGTFRLMNVRLTANGETLAFAEPDVAQIQVAENFLVSEVQVKPLSEQDLIDRGYLFSRDDYYSVEFELALTIGSTKETVTVPVAYPKKNTESYQPVVLEDPFKPYVRMLAFKQMGEGSMLPGYLDDPPATQNYVPGLILIPGNFNYLRSHFEVTCLVLNAAPEGFDVRVRQLESRLKLPDPTLYGLPLSIKESVVKDMSFLGPDETRGTSDDRDYILPGEQAQSDYVVIGNIPGMYDVEIEVKGLLDLPQSSTDVTTISQGQIFVRSPEFTVDFEHPDAVAQGEAYDLVMTITNRGEIPLEGFSVTLDPDGLIGVELNGSHPVQSPGSIPVGGAGTVTWSLRALISGRVISNYFKIDGDVPGALQLRTGVGETGQRISPYVLHFPPVFYDEFPADLTANLRRFSKTALDFSQMTPAELPAGLSAVSPTAVREFNSLMTSAAQSGAYGVSDREQLVRLFQLWVRGVNEYAPLDAVRRRMHNLNIVDLETHFGNAFATTFAGMSDRAMLELIARENERTPHLHAAIIATSAAAAVRLRQGDRINAATREIPFAAALPLGSNRTLIWLAGADTTPIIDIVPTLADVPATADVTAVFPNTDDSRTYLAARTGAALGTRLSISFDPVAGRMALTPAEGAPVRADGAVVSPKAFELLRVRQADPKILAGADTYGRDFIFSFSKGLDLGSLDPIEEHLFINGEPAVDAQLQRDGRTLIASSRMPLGPYHPIAYELRGARSVDDQALDTQSESIQGSAWFTGVSVSGKIVDRNGSDLREAVVFHWRFTADGWLIFDKTKLDASNRYLFEFSPYLPYLEEKQTLKIGVLLSDGRYEEREFYPRGAGQELIADFAFLQQGTIQGTVRDSDGNPVVNADVYAVNQDNELSAVIVQTDGNGFYRAEGLEVGQILVKSSHQAIVGYASGYLTQTNSPLTVDVVIDNPSATLEGRITVNRDGVSQPVPRAYVAFLLQNGLAGALVVGNTSYPYAVITRTDENGNYRLENAPAGNGFFWVYDGYNGYFERLIVLEDGKTRVENHEYDGNPVPTGSISGHVRTTSGLAVAGARVLAEGQAVTSGPDGAFLLEHLTLNKTHAVVAQHESLGRGTAGVSLDSAHVSNVDIVVRTPIQISGRYVDQDGQGVGYAFIYNPPYGAVFSPLAQTDGSGYWSAILPEPGAYAITTMDTPDIAAIPELNVTEAGASDILLQRRPKADLRVRLVDENGRPIVAKVDLESTMPSPFTLSLGIPMLRPTHVDHFTDTNGEIIFRDLNVGEFKVFGHSGQFGETEVFSGTLTPVPQGEEPLTVTLVFPNTLDPANLFGQVFAVDGVSPAPAGTLVQVKGPGLDATVEVDATGNYRFDTLVQTAEPVRLNVIASHPTLGIFDTAWFDLHRDLNFRYDLSLKRQGNVTVRVINGDGTPVDFAAVRISYRDVEYVPPTGPDLFGLFREIPISEDAQITPDTPELRFTDIPQGDFTLRANTGNGLVALRSFVIPVEARDLDVVLKLEAASSISGTFLNHESQPIPAAEIQLLERNALLQQRLSDDSAGNEGRFLFDELPMRDYKLYGVDPANAFEAHLDVTTSPYRPNPDVDLVLDPIGHLEGYVLFNGQPVSNAQIELSGNGSKIITGSDLEGRYRFRNLPLGNYAVRAESPAVIGKVNTGVTVSRAFVVNEFNLNFGETRTVELYVASSDGMPAGGVLVTAENLNYRQVVGNSAYTDDNGVAVLTDLPVGTYRISGEHPTEVVHLSGTFTITDADPDPVQRQTAFGGYGQISGQVTTTSGLPLDEPAHITFKYVVNFTRVNVTITTDATGAYRIGRIPIDTRIDITAYNQATQEVATRRIELDFHGEERVEDLSFRAATYASGTVRYSDGRPAAGAEVWIDEPYRVKVAADESGFFYLAPILEGPTTLFAKERSGERKLAFDLDIALADHLPVPASNLDLTLGGVADVTGTVAYSDGTVLRVGGVTLTIPQLDAEFTAIIQGDGSFRFSQIPLGDYSLVAHDRTFNKDSAPVDASAVSDGEVVDVPITFEASYQLTGRLYAANGIDPAIGGQVELWRPREDKPSEFELIYAAETNDQGYYLIDHIYPGNYRVQAEDAEQVGFFADDHLMRSEDMNRDLYLQSRAWLLGAIADADGDPYTSGTMALSQNGRTWTTRVEVDGSFRFDDLSPGPYALTYTVAGGWLSQTVNGTLTNGANSLPLSTVRAVTLEGRAVLIRDPAAKPSVYFRYNQKPRNVNLAADGVFSLPEVPADLAVELNLVFGGMRRTETVQVATDSDIGTYYLDTTPPVINFAGDGGVVTALPYTLDFAVSENDPQSQWDTAATRVWVNSTEITDLFTTTAGGISAQLDSLPDGFVLGANTLRVVARNAAGAVRDQNFELYVDLNGVSLTVELTRSGASTNGQVRLGDGEWTLTNGAGRVIFPNVTPGSYTIKARNAEGGARLVRVLNDAVNQYLTLGLVASGSYTGRVLDESGNPLSGVVVSSGGQFETTDANGEYIFDLLPLGAHELMVSEPGLLGYLAGAPLLSNGDVVAGSDIQLRGTGMVSGVVYDDDGLTPVPGAAVVLDHDDLPAGLNLETVAGPDGAFSFEGVMRGGFQLLATEPGGRTGLAASAIAAAGDVVTQNIQLSPAGNITALIVDLDGNPVADLEVIADGPDFDFVGHTDGAGRISFANLPFGLYALRAEYRAGFQYLVHQHLVDRDNADLGTLTLIRDNEPQILAFEMPAVYDLATRPNVRLAFNDDRQVRTFRILYTGAYTATVQRYVYTADHDVAISVSLPITAELGTLNWTVEVEDSMAQISSLSGTTELTYSLPGPDITITEPANGASFVEGEPFDIRVNAVDPTGVASVTATLDGMDLGSLVNGPFNFSANAPGVTETRTVALTISATNRRDLTTSLTYDLIVNPVNSAGGPRVTLMAPLPGMPLPLSLEAGLTLQFAARAHDEDGLESYSVRVAGEEVLQNPLSGEDALIEASWPLPDALRGSDDLLVEMIVRDQGGNPTVTVARVQNMPIDAEVTLADEANPLELQDFDVSLRDKTVVLVGGSHIIDGPHRFANLVLVNGATLTQTQTGTNGPARLTDLTVTGAMVVDYAAAVDTTRKGWTGMPPGFGYSGWTPSHGGLGHTSTDFRLLYGSPFQPTMPGSGRGGGALKFTADTFWLSGSISADGRADSPSSGGSVWLTGNRFEGHGRISANGFSGPYAASNYYGGGGGRVAVYGPFDGTAQAFGGRRAGAGTVYYQRPDADAPRGYTDRMVIANHPDATVFTGTAIRTLHGPVAGSEFTSEIRTIENLTRQVLTFATVLPRDSFLGMSAYKNDAFETVGKIAQQTETTLRSLPEETFSTFEDGDVLHVDYRVDSFEIRDNAHFHLLDQKPLHGIQVGGSAALTLGDSPMAFAAGELELADGATVNGHLTLDQFELNTGTLNLNGSVTASSIDVAAGAVLRAPADTPDARITLDAPTIRIAGTLAATDNRASHNPNNLYTSTHGGYGGAISYDTHATFGSLYHPLENGRYRMAGGAVLLRFQALELDGVIDVSGDLSGSGGSILLEGGAGATLIGAGVLNADGAGDNNNYATGGGGRIAVLVDDISGFSGSATAKGGLYPATPNYDLHQAGAGTVFYRTTDWPVGRLVIDNGGKPSRPGSTELPGLGYHTATQAMSGSTITLANLPELGGLTGLAVAFPGGEFRTITAHDTDSLTLDADMPELLADDVYHGLHRLNVLELRGKANLRTIDAIEVLDELVVESGVIDAGALTLPVGISRLADGSLELTTDPGLSGDLELDNFQLTTHFPIDLDSLTLRNGASLRLVGDWVNRIDTLTVADGTLAYSGTLNATTVDIQGTLELNGALVATTSVTLGGSGTLRTPDGVAGATLNVTAPAIELAGTVLALNNPVAPNPGGRYDRNHGGIGSVRELDTADTMGSLYRPTTNGGGAGSGGSAAFYFTNLDLSGEVDVDGTSNGAGGSVLFEGASLTGTGLVHANGSGGYYSGGGGRIGLLVEDLSGFTGTVQAFGGFYSTTYPENNGGAGTVFYRNSTWPNGRLVLDNNGTETRAGSTLLPGLGQRPVAATTEAGNTLSGNGFAAFSSLTGLYAVIGGSEVLIDANTEFELNASAGFPAVTEGDVYTGLHILDVLEIHGGANLKTPDAIRVLDDVIQGDGSIDSPDLQIPVDGVLADGSAEYFEDPGFTSLELNNFHLTVHFPLDLTRLTLNNGSSLTTDQLIDSATVTVNDGEIVLNGTIVADNLTLSENGVIRTPLNLTDAGVFLDVSGQLRLLGTIQALRNPNSTNPGDLYAGSHGGYAGEIDFAVKETYGSLYRPVTNGTGNVAGGRIHLRFDSLELGGNIDVSALRDAFDAGGSILLEGNRLFGAGAMRANGSNDYRSGGGGRIAILVTDTDGFTGEAQAFGGNFNASFPQQNGGAGTVFYRTGVWPNGRLVIDNNGTTSRRGSTALPALGQQTAAQATGGATLDGDSFPGIESLNGMHVLFADGSTAAIAAQSQTQLFADGAFPQLAEGDTYSGIHILDVLEIRGGAHLQTPDAIRVLDQMVVEGGSIDTPALELPPGYAFRDGALELFHDLGYSQIQLDNFELTTRFPLNVNSIDLINGAGLVSDQPVTATEINVVDGTVSMTSRLRAEVLTVGVGGVLETPSGTRDSLLTVDADVITMAGVIRSRNSGSQTNPNRIFDYNHGGFGPGSSAPDSVGFGGRETFGTLYAPVLPGRGQGTELGAGGAVRVVFGSMELMGTIDVNGQGRSAAGSVLLEGQTLTGTGSMSANGGNDYYSSGGGRIALLVGDVSGFSGPVTAFGGRFSDGSLPYRNAGAGTVYYRTTDWPNGRLVIDNNGLRTLPGSTQLPGLGARTADEATGGVAISGSFPSQNDLHGLYVRFADERLVAIDSHTETELTPVGAFPALAAGDAYSGLHLFDVLEVRNGGSLKTDDAIRVTQTLVTEDGAIDSPQLEIPAGYSFTDGALELFEDPGLTQLALDNFNLTVHFPLDLDSLTLTNGATLTSTARVRATAVDVVNGAIVLNGSLVADQLTVSADGILQTPNGVLDAVLTIEAQTMTMAGVIQSRNNGGQYNPNRIYDYNHGGFGPGSNASDSVGFGDRRTYGSLYAPVLSGRGQGSELGAGGAVRVVFGSLALTGGINVNGQGRHSAGSILLEGETLTGTGSLSANGGDDYYSSGGGRIALLVNDVDGYSGAVTAFGGRFSDGSLDYRNAGAGTVFYRTSHWPNGRLVLDNNGLRTRSGSTFLPGLGSQVAAVPTGGDVISGEGYPALGGLVGLNVLFADGTTVPIADHSTLELIPETAFPMLDEGDTYAGLHIFDVLEVRGNANLKTIDGIRVLEQFVLEDGSIDSPDLEIPADGTLSNGSVELFEDPGYGFLELDNFHLIVHYPLDVERITLLNGATLTTDRDIQSGRVDIIDGALAMNGTLNTDRLAVDVNGVLKTADNVIDAELTLNAPIMVISGTVAAELNGGAYNPGNRYQSSNGGYGGGVDFATRDTLGSLYHPQTAGRGENSAVGGGGVIRMTFTTLELNGNISVNGSTSRAAGSVLLQGSGMSGAGTITANGADDWQAGGGGRVAVLVNDTTAFSGGATAFGGKYSNGSLNYRNGGAGTVFYQTDVWPNGRLILDNNGLATLERSTTLPGLGERVVVSEAVGNVVEGVDFPEFSGLTGLYLQSGLETRRIIGNDTTALNLEGDPLGLPLGQTYSGIHILDVLEIRGAANLYSEDAIRVLDSFSFEGGTLETAALELPNSHFQNGAVTLYTAPNQQDLQLTQFTLTMRTGLDLVSLTLNDGAVLDLDAPVAAGVVTVAQTAAIRARSEGNRYNPNNRFQSSHGGFGGGVDYEQRQTLGSQYYPQTEGRGDNTAAGAGGLVQLSFNTMDLAGTIDVNGSGSRSGGSILLEGAALTGAGLLTANGGDDWQAGGGGRIAVLVDDVSGFSGTARAFGGKYSNGSLDYRNGGAGTVFYRTQEWRHGRLIIDNNGLASLSGSTRLPGIGERIAYEADGPTIFDSNLPALNGLAGMYVEFLDRPLVKVASNTESELTLDDEAFFIESGESFVGVHLLDVLEVRGGANLASIDKIQVLDSFVFDGGSVNALDLALPEGSVLANGSATLLVNPGIADLSLDNFQLTLRTQLGLDSLTLSNGSVLNLDRPLASTTIAVDATSTIRSRGDGQILIPDPAYASSHGGLGGGVDYDVIDTHGTLYRPETEGRDANGSNTAGGAIHLTFTSMNLDGRLDVNGQSSRSGGSILLEGATLTGSGAISANGGDDYQAGAGGRIALLVGDVSGFTGPVTAFGGRYSNGSLDYRNGGAGTVFYRTSAWPNGRLVIDNNGLASLYGSTRLPGIGPGTVEAAEPGLIYGSGYPNFNGLHGLRLSFGEGLEVPISGNTSDLIILGDNGFEAQPGDNYSGVHVLDVLEVRGAANLTAIDTIRVLDSFRFDGGSIDVPGLVLPEGSSFSNGSATLFVDPGVRDLHLDNFQLSIRAAFDLDSLSLVNNSTINLYETLHATTIDIATGSTIIARAEGDEVNPNNRYRSSHGGLGGGVDYEIVDTFGSLYGPTTAGRGNNAQSGAGGVIHLTFDTLNLDGRLDADGVNERSGGSILLEGSVLTGGGALSANGGNSYEAGGGGRIGILVNQIDGFIGSATAFGGIYSNGSLDYRNGGAGTVFYRTSEWPNGRLVLDNNGHKTLYRSTRLPGLGDMLVASSDGVVLTGGAFPALGGLTGLKVWDGVDVLAGITSHTETALTLDNETGISAGDQISGIHVLDVLEVRGGANLYAIDSILVLQSFDFQGGSIEAQHLELPEGATFSGGSIELFVDPSLDALTLDAFYLTLHTPLNLAALDLANESVLTLQAPLQADIINVAASTAIRSTYRGDGYTPGDRFRSSHGGIGAVDNIVTESFGSLYQPLTSGRGTANEAGPGGVVNLTFDTLNLAGSIDVSGASRQHYSGGSILLQGNVLSGVGHLNANGGNNYQAGGGGRIAVLVEDLNNFSGSATAFGGFYSNGSIRTRNAGAGTVFYRNSRWPNGRLVVDNNGILSPEGSTPLPGLGQRYFEGPSEPTTIAGSDFAPLNSLVGLHVDHNGTLAPIVAHTDSELTLAQPIFDRNDEEPYQGVHVLDVLEVRGAANLTGPDGINVHEELIVDPNTVVDLPFVRTQFDLPEGGNEGTKGRINGNLDPAPTVDTIEAAAFVGEDLVLEAGDTLLRGTQRFKRIVLKPGSSLVVEGDLDADQIDLWRAELTVKGSISNPTPRLTARLLTARESRVFGPSLAIHELIDLDADSLLAPARQGSRDSRLVLDAEALILDGTVDLYGGELRANLGRLQADGGRVQGALLLAGGSLDGVALGVERLVSRSPLFLSQSMIHAAVIEAPYLGLEHGTQLHPLIGELKLAIGGGVMIDHTSAVILDGVVRDAGAPVHGGLFYDDTDRPLAATSSMLYDSPVYPSRPGSGEAGGGALTLICDTLELDGTLTARGQGWSSGGAILIQAGALRGLGLIDARGGEAAVGFGGGGRIAVHTSTLTNFGGQILSGVSPEADGTLVLAGPKRDAVQLLSARDGDGTAYTTTSAVLPNLSFTADAVRNTALAADGTVLLVKADLPFHDTLGLWLRANGEHFRVLAVEPVDRDTWRLRLRGRPKLSGVLTFVLVTDKATSNGADLPIVEAAQ